MSRSKRFEDLSEDGERRGAKSRERLGSVRLALRVQTRDRDPEQVTAIPIVAIAPLFKQRVVPVAQVIYEALSDLSSTTE